MRVKFTGFENYAEKMIQSFHKANENTHKRHSVILRTIKREFKQNKLVSSGLIDGRSEVTEAYYRYKGLPFGATLIGAKNYFLKRFFQKVINLSNEIGISIILNDKRGYAKKHIEGQIKDFPKDFKNKLNKSRVSRNIPPRPFMRSFTELKDVRKVVDIVFKKVLREAVNGYRITKINKK